MAAVALPVMPDCGKPAEWHVFGCASATGDARYARPIVKVNACGEHLHRIAAVLNRAALTAVPVDLSLVPPTRHHQGCGHRVDLQTGSDDLDALRAKLNGDTGSAVS